VRGPPERLDKLDTVISTSSMQASEARRMGDLVIRQKCKEYLDAFC
jgi:hypothetical protein